MYIPTQLTQNLCTLNLCVRWIDLNILYMYICIHIFPEWKQINLLTSYFDCSSASEATVGSMLSKSVLTYWGQVNCFIIASDNGLSPVRCQAITWTNAGLFVNWPLGNIHVFQRNFNHNTITVIEETEVQNVVCKLAASYHGLNVLRIDNITRI